MGRLPIILLFVISECLASFHNIQEEDLKLYEYLARKGLKRFNKESDDDNLWDLDRTWNVERSLSGGIHYKIDVTLVKTNCDKFAIDHSNCEKTDKLKRCTVEAIRRHKNHNGLKDYAKIRNCEEEFTRNLVEFDKQKIELTHDDAISIEDLRRAKIIKPKDYIHWNYFLDFMDRHKKIYRDKREVLKRFRIFKRNSKLIREVQANEQGTAVYGHTQFSDMSQFEFKKTILPYIWDQPVYPLKEANYTEENINEKIPESFDWRDHGAVTQVKNQGNCGSCWAFSATGNIEGAWYIAKKRLVSLSEQELVDCDSLDQGCNGGLPSNAYNEIMRMGGLETEDDYPYDGRGETCHFIKDKARVFINGSVELPRDEVKLQQWLYNKGPISIGINANTLQFYRHGIVHPFKIFCEPFMLNHGVLLVGYGTEGTKKPYWIVKNSWGSKWGENGYFRLYRGKNVCGVQELATSALVK